MPFEFDPDQLGKQAYQYVYRLAREIGPRPAGQKGERQAAELIAGLLQSWGYRTQRQEFAFPPAPRFFPYYTLLAVVFLVAVLLLPVFPYLCLLLPLLAAALPRISDWLLASLPKTARSANLLALFPADSEANVDLLFCAHLDTARAIPYRGNFLHRLSSQVDDAALRLGLILAAIALFPILGLALPPAVDLAALTVSGLLVLVLVGLDLWQQLGENGRYTPGVSDNASGLGVLLALAELLASFPPAHLKVGFLFTSAEECGLYGAEQYAARLQNAGLKPFVVNVDMVGSGDKLRFMQQSGPFLPVTTSAPLNSWLQRAEPELRPLYTRRTSDFAPFLKKGIPAAGLESNGSPRFWRAYHTLQDGLALAEEPMLARTAAALARLVALLERDRASQK